MITVLQCPQCTAPLNPNSKKCDFCGSEIFVSSIAYLCTKDTGVVANYLSTYQELLNDNPRNLEANIGLGLCFLIRGISNQAKKYFSTAIDIDRSCAHGYYYRTLCEIAGLPYERLDINIVSSALKYLKLAYDINPELHFSYLIRRLVDRFYLANYLRVPFVLRDVYSSELDTQLINESELSKINDLIKF